MRSGSPTEVPPNFWTRRATGGNGTSGPVPFLNRFGTRGGRVSHRWVRSGAVGTNANKHARQKEHRDRLAEAREQVDAAAKRRRMLTIVGAVIALVVVIGAVVLLTGGGDD